MKLKDILEFAIEQGMRKDPREIEEIKRQLEGRKTEYEKLKGVEKRVFDTESLSNPYSDTRIIHGKSDEEVNHAWVGIDVDTSELLLVDRVSGKKDSRPVVISHHPFGRAYSNFYDVMDLQADALEDAGVAVAAADNITRSRKGEVSRKVSAVNHFKAQDAARILNIPALSIHTPADNQVADYLKRGFDKEKPLRLKNAVDFLMGIPEYEQGAKNGVPPKILAGNPENRCGKVYVDMTGGTENDAVLLEKLVSSGISTVIAMHMSEKHYKKAQKENINIIIAGHIPSDSLGFNLLLDKLIKTRGNIEITGFSGFIRIKRDG